MDFQQLGIFVADAISGYDTIKINNTGNEWRSYRVTITDGDDTVSVECAAIDEGLEEAMAQMAELQAVETVKE